MDEMLSVIVPIYNEDKYLNQCLESIVNQTYRALEIILVNDGSTDSSATICDVFAKHDARITVINKKNGGLISARYAGLVRATSKYVTFVDGDDWIKPNMYNNLMKLILEKKVDVVTSGFILYKSDFEWKEHKDDQISPGEYNREMMEKNIIPQMVWNREYDKPSLGPSLSNKIFKKNILLECYEKLKDYKFYFREDAAVTYPYILKADKTYFTHECLYFYRQRKRENIPSYIQSENYFDELYEFYKYLKSIFTEEKNSEILIKQLECLYIGDVLYRKKKMINDGFTYLFPFNKIDKGSRVILYGAGKVGHEYYEQVTRLQYCKIVLWVDRNYQDYIKEGVADIKAILDVEYDCIVIANASKDISQFITKELIGLGIPRAKIYK